MNNIVLFASGSGTNAENIALFFKDHPDTEVSYILSNRPDAGVLERAKKLNIKTKVFNRDDFFSTCRIHDFLISASPDLIVLAGFLWLVPSNIVEAFPRRIVNIHPALLPNYGGKGMYGHHVHEAVLRNGEKESGITIHYVNDRYDDGDIIFQAHCPIEADDSPESLASRIHQLEYEHYPRVIAEVLAQQKQNRD
ncbi:phosphoribosylglycinamide formyltransferase [Thermophagus sp. OGC60D27]|uniref:phosphoribosylglycinamide formyltransferase n=1 Tax=Thermophagus sp. OGC60D27 TaxID=3458415 RepID=UPI00403780D2